MIDQGFETPAIRDNSLESLNRTVGTLVEYINHIHNSIKSNKIKGDLKVDGDIYTNDLITSENSIYIGKKDIRNKLESINTDLFFNRVKLTSTTGSPGIAEHNEIHEDGGYDEIDHDNLSGFVADEHIDWKGTTQNLLTTGTVATGRLIQTDPYHAFGGFQDESETISIDEETWTHVTNVANDLWNALEEDGISISGDEIVVTNAGDYTGVISITFVGALTKDYIFRIYNVTQSAVSGYHIGATGKGIGNYTNVCIPMYLEAAAADHFQLQAYCATRQDATFRSAIFQLIYLHS